MEKNIRPCVPWTLEDVHEVYGKVIMVRSIEGEPYRWLEKDGYISMIPLSLLLNRDMTEEDMQE